AAKEACDLDGRTPLLLSCIVQCPSAPATTTPLCLLRAGAVATAADAQGTTALDIAVRYGRAEIVREIFSRREGAPRPIPGNLGVLYQAVRGGDAGIVACLVNNGWEGGVPVVTASPQPPPPSLQSRETSGAPVPSPVGRKGATASSPSAEAAAGSPASVAAVRETLSPLMLAADSGRVDVVRALLRGRHGGFPNAGDTRGYTALHFATMRGSVGIAEALLQGAASFRKGAGGGENNDNGNGDGGVVSFFTGGTGAGAGAAAAAKGAGTGDGAAGAASAGSPAAVAADPDVTNADGDTALHVAVATRRIGVGQALLRAGASVGIANGLGHTALHFAAALGLSGFAKELLDRGADAAAVDGTESSSSANAAGASGGGGGGGVILSSAGGRNARHKTGGDRRAKIAAAVRVTATVAPRRRGSSATSTPSAAAAVAVAAAASPNAGRGRCTRVSAAALATSLASPLSKKPSQKRRASTGTAATVRLGGGSPNRRKEGRTPLHFAAMNGRVGTARVLLAAGAPPAHRRNRKRESPLFLAARGGHAEVVKLLLEALRPGTHVDAATAAGETPLGVASANGHDDVVVQLLRKGAAVVGCDDKAPCLDLGWDDKAPSLDLTSVLKTLLKGNPAGARTARVLSAPLHAACRGGGRTLVEALLEKGADVNASQDPAGEEGGSRRMLRPLHVAAAHGNAEAVGALTLRGCLLDIKTRDPGGSTPLGIAVQEGHLEAARALVDAGAAIDAVPRGQDGKERATSLARLAADMRRGDMVALLARALVDRDSSETWAIEWAASKGFRVGGLSAAAGAVGAVGGAVVGAEEEEAETVEPGAATVSRNARAGVAGAVSRADVGAAEGTGVGRVVQATVSRSERAQRRSFLSEGKGGEEVLVLGEARRLAPGRRGPRQRAGL
ncbi:unnamed protein product, partial [Ectocarpus sp. 8 AP-2014]